MKSDLPNSSQFSPVQTPLPKLLLLVKQFEPDRKAVSLAILKEFFPDRGERTAWDWKLADNTIIAMSQYGLVNKPTKDQSHASLTDLGHKLAEKAEEANYTELYAEFARHILLNLRGLEVLASASDLEERGEIPTKASIIKELSKRNIYHPPNGTHANGMRQWFEQAGLVEKDQWVANKERLQEILGISTEEIDVLAGLTKEQRDFAKAFARLNVEHELSNKIAQYATTLYGTEFPEGGLPQSVLFTLSDAGLITYKKTTMGQGAKPYIVYATEKLNNDILEPILNTIEKSVGIQYRILVRKKYTDILAELKSSSRHVKGLALEALAFNLGRLLGLHFVQWRLRSAVTGGAELDVVMEGDRLVFSRWQIQCKNSAQATLEDIAKEVGIAQVIKANVILIVCTGKIGPAARIFTKQVMEETNLYVALLDGKDLEQLARNPANIASIMNNQAREAMTIKKAQVSMI